MAFPNSTLIHFAFPWGLQSLQILLKALKVMTHSYKHIPANTFTHVNNCVDFREITIMYIAEPQKLAEVVK